MAWTTTDLEALERAIAQGAMKVKYKDREVTYRSLSEMLQLKDLIEKSIGVKSSTIRVIKTSFSKGL